MRRTTFDLLLSTTGLIVTLVLVVAGALLMWGYTYTNSTVTQQLTSQKIYFPAKNSPEIKAPEFAQMKQYAGQLMTNGAQAQVYANHFIANHLKAIGGGKTYSQLSAQALAQPNNTKLADTVNTLFKGTTLRSMLLNAYAFWMLGQIALVASIASFVLAGVMLVLTVFGYAHLRRAPEEQEVFTAKRREAVATR